MKKLLLLIFPIFLVGCTSLQLRHHDKCIGHFNLEIFHMDYDGSLVYIDRFWKMEHKWERQLAFLPERNSMYYDGLVVGVPKGKCLIQTGSYTYTTKDKTRKTVMKVEFIDSKIPKHNKD